MMVGSAPRGVADDSGGLAPGKATPTADASGASPKVDREFCVMSALHGSLVPVPKPLLYCDDASIVGTPFYLMEWLRGRVFFEYATPTLDAAARRACYDSMCRTMAAIHRFDWQAAGLTDFGRPGNYFGRQIKRWSEQWFDGFHRATVPNVLKRSRE